MIIKGLFNIFPNREILARILIERESENKPREIAMTRISRIKTPRATVLTFALLVIVMLGFGAFAEMGHDEPATVAQETETLVTGATTARDWLRLSRL